MQHLEKRSFSYWMRGTSRPIYLLVLLIIPAILGGTSPILLAPDYTEPGAVVQIMIAGDPMDNIVVTLRNQDDIAISRNEGFNWKTPTGRRVSTALLGIPANLEPGPYRLVVDATLGRSQWRLERGVRLSAVRYSEEVIKLNEKMNALYTDESGRKEAEARQFWAVLNTPNKTAIHQIGSLSNPMKNGVLTAYFGDRRRYHMPDGSESSSIHGGYDLWAEIDAPVEASGRGRVVLAADRLLTGNTVIIEHLPGVFTVYFHMDSIDVREGELVEQNQRIGTIGDTGFATGRHLHWELRIGFTPVDSKYFLEKPLLDTDALIGKM